MRCCAVLPPPVSQQTKQVVQRLGFDSPHDFIHHVNLMTGSAFRKHVVANVSSDWDLGAPFNQQVSLPAIHPDSERWGVEGGGSSQSKG